MLTLSPHPLPHAFPFSAQLESVRSSFTFTRELVPALELELVLVLVLVAVAVLE